MKGIKNGKCFVVEYTVRIKEFQKFINKVNKRSVKVNDIITIEPKDFLEVELKIIK